MDVFGYMGMMMTFLLGSSELGRREDQCGSRPYVRAARDARCAED